MFFCNSDLSPAPYKYTRSLGRYAPLLLAPAKGLGAHRVLLGAFGPLLSCSIQKYTLRRLFGHLILQNPLRFFLSHFIWLPQEAYWEVGEGAEGPFSCVHMSLGIKRVPHPSAWAWRRVAIGHPNLLVAKIAKIAATPSIVVKSSQRGFLGSLGAFIENSEMIVWSRISICSCRYLNNWNLSIICHFITV